MILDQLKARTGTGCALVGVLVLSWMVAACSLFGTRYDQVERKLRAGNPQAADRVIADAADDYGPKNRVLYAMDRGMTLHLAGEYRSSNEVLEHGVQRLEQLYARRIHRHMASFAVNDTILPYRGWAHEQVLMHILKAVNYACLEDWEGALVEARRIDHQLNLRTDQVQDEDGYRDDAFARYVTGILYEATDEVNNAFIAYRKAYDVYRRTRSWSGTPVPDQLKAALLRTTESLGLTEEHQAYRTEFTEVSPSASLSSGSSGRESARLVVLGYTGRGPRLGNRFVDLPISLDALKLVILNRAGGNHESVERRVFDSLLYGLHGRIVRVALPSLLPGESRLEVGSIALRDDRGVVRAEAEVELVYRVTALARELLEDQYPTIATRAVARAAAKYAAAEGLGAVVENRVGEERSWIGSLVRVLARGLAIGTEEADTRTWGTLPAEIHMAQIRVPSGSYTVVLHGTNAHGAPLDPPITRHVTLEAGATRFVIARILS